MLEFVFKFTSPAQIELLRKLLDNHIGNLKFHLAAHASGENDNILAYPDEVKEELRIAEQLLERLPE